MNALIRKFFRNAPTISIVLGTLGTISVSFLPNDTPSTFALCYKAETLGMDGMDAFEEVVRRGEDCADYRQDIAYMREIDANKKREAAKDNSILNTVDHDNAD
jgi:hypothetical protein